MRGRVADYVGAGPRTFQVLEEFHLRQIRGEPGEVGEQALRLRLRSRDRNDGRVLTLTFHDVRDLRFEPGGSGAGLGFLELVDIRSRGWEGVRYAVDEDGTQLSFLGVDVADGGTQPP